MNLQHFFNDVLHNGGASYNITTGEYNPTNGYFVSVPKHKQKIPLNEFTQQTVKDFISKNSEFLTETYTFLGGLVKGDIVYLDVTNQFKDKRFALTLAYNSGQMAVLDANNGKDIELPTPQLSGTFTQQRSYMFQKIDELCK